MSTNTQSKDVLRQLTSVLTAMKGSQHQIDDDTITPFVDYYSQRDKALDLLHTVKETILCSNSNLIENRVILDPVDCLGLLLKFDSIAMLSIKAYIAAIHNECIAGKQAIYCVSEIRIYFESLRMLQLSKQQSLSDFIDIILDIGKYILQPLESESTLSSKLQAVLTTAELISSCVNILVDISRLRLNPSDEEEDDAMEFNYESILIDYMLNKLIWDKRTLVPLATVMCDLYGHIQKDNVIILKDKIQSEIGTVMSEAENFGAVFRVYIRLIECSNGDALWSEGLFHLYASASPRILYEVESILEHILIQTPMVKNTLVHYLNSKVDFQSLAPHSRALHMNFLILIARSTVDLSYTVVHRDMKLPKALFHEMIDISPDISQISVLFMKVLLQSTLANANEVASLVSTCLGSEHTANWLAVARCKEIICCCFHLILIIAQPVNSKGSNGSVKVTVIQQLSRVIQEIVNDINEKYSLNLHLSAVVDIIVCLVTIVYTKIPVCQDSINHILFSGIIRLSNNTKLMAHGGGDGSSNVNGSPSYGHVRQVYFSIIDKLIEGISTSSTLSSSSSSSSNHQSHRSVTETANSHLILQPFQEYLPMILPLCADSNPQSNITSLGDWLLRIFPKLHRLSVSFLPAFLGILRKYSIPLVQSKAMIPQLLYQTTSQSITYSRQRERLFYAKIIIAVLGASMSSSDWSNGVYTDIIQGLIHVCSFQLSIRQYFYHSLQELLSATLLCQRQRHSTQSLSITILHALWNQIRCLLSSYFRGGRLILQESYRSSSSAGATAVTAATASSESKLYYIDDISQLLSLCVLLQELQQRNDHRNEVFHRLQQRVLSSGGNNNNSSSNEDTINSDSSSLWVYVDAILSVNLEEIIKRNWESDSGIRQSNLLNCYCFYSVLCSLVDVFSLLMSIHPDQSTNLEGVCLDMKASAGMVLDICFQFIPDSNVKTVNDLHGYLQHNHGASFHHTVPCTVACQLQQTLLIIQETLHGSQTSIPLTSLLASVSLLANQAQQHSSQLHQQQQQCSGSDYEQFVQLYKSGFCKGTELLWIQCYTATTQRGNYSSLILTKLIDSVNKLGITHDFHEMSLKADSGQKTAKKLDKIIESSISNHFSQARSELLEYLNSNRLPYVSSLSNSDKLTQLDYWVEEVKDAVEYGLSLRSFKAYLDIINELSSFAIFNDSSKAIFLDKLQEILSLFSSAQHGVIHHLFSIIFHIATPAEILTISKKLIGIAAVSLQRTFATEEDTQSEGGGPSAVGVTIEEYSITDISVDKRIVVLNTPVNSQLNRSTLREEEKSNLPTAAVAMDTATAADGNVGLNISVMESCINEILSHLRSSLLNQSFRHNTATLLETVGMIFSGSSINIDSNSSTVPLPLPLPLPLVDNMSIRSKSLVLAFFSKVLHFVLKDTVTVDKFTKRKLRESISPKRVSPVPRHSATAAVNNNLKVKSPIRQRIQSPTPPNDDDSFTTALIGIFDNNTQLINVYFNLFHRWLLTLKLELNSNWKKQSYTIVHKNIDSCLEKLQVIFNRLYDSYSRLADNDVNLSATSSSSSTSSSNGMGWMLFKKLTELSDLYIPRAATDVLQTPDEDSEIADYISPMKVRKSNTKLRSRNTVVDDWLEDENGEDNYFDLEDFIVPV